MVLRHGDAMTVTMKQFQAQLHSDLGRAVLWGCNGQYPGPTFEVRSGETVRVNWVNELPVRHYLPVDFGRGELWPRCGICLK